MQVINAVWKAVFGDGKSADEVRAELLALLVLHNTPGRYAAHFDNPALFAVLTAAGKHDVYAFVAKKAEWRKTNGDYAPGGVLPQIMPDHIVRAYLEEYVITDGTVIDHARRHTAPSSGYEVAGFFDKFLDDEHVIVFFYRVHFEAKLALNTHGALVLTEPLNKTKDPYCVFLPAARIKRIEPGKDGMEYEIMLPEPEAVRDAYNKECVRVGRKPV
jgi:hypothetical protein